MIQITENNVYNIALLIRDILPEGEQKKKAKQFCKYYQEQSNLHNINRDNYVYDKIMKGMTYAQSINYRRLQKCNSTT